MQLFTKFKEDYAIVTEKQTKILTVNVEYGSLIGGIYM